MNYNFEKPGYEPKDGTKADIVQMPIETTSCQTIAKPSVMRSVCSLKHDHYFLKNTGIDECPECGESFLQTDA